MSTFIGITLGLIAVIGGLLLKGASLAALWNPAAFVIIFVGTAASLFVGFPMSELKKVPPLLQYVFKEPKQIPKRDLVKLFKELATLARREGILALEEKIRDIEDDFLNNGVQLVVDGTDRDQLKGILLEEIHAIEERHRVGALIFSQAGTYAPTLGVLGAVIGLIAALGNLSDIDMLGRSIAAAFVATLLGIFSGYVLWHPLANKLKRLSSRETEVKYLIAEGILSLQAGMSPQVIEQILIVHLSSQERGLLKQSEIEANSNE